MGKRAALDRIKAASKRIDQRFPFPELRTGSLPSSTAMAIFGQYRIVSIDFPKVLCAVAARLSTDQGRLGIISNLWDEHGRGRLEDSHRAMLDRFIDRVDISLNGATARPTWQTRLFLNGMNGLAGQGAVSEAVGMLLFFEAVTPAEYRSVIAWLQKSTDLNEEDWRFWADHVEHDGDHLRELFDSTLEHEALIESELLDGVAQACQLEAIFWGQFEELQ